VKQFVLIFLSVFVAEVGDKTQLASMLFATDQNIGRLRVFLAASAALVVSTLIAVLVGGAISKVVGESTLKIVAGAGFILIGLWTLVSAYR
jgi:putative Ca2+/H+ antiporter (TMEM165/GDT1 family)